jgi:hypothetical protein
MLCCLTVMLCGALAAAAQPTAEVGLALSSLSDDAVSRLTDARGGGELLPMVLADLKYHDQTQTVVGTVRLKLQLATEQGSVLLRINANARHPGSVRTSEVSVNGQTATVEPVDASVFRVHLPKHVGTSLELQMKVEGTVPSCEPNFTDAIGTLFSKASPKDCSWGAARHQVSLLGLMPLLATRQDTGERIASTANWGDLAAADISNFIVTIETASRWEPLGPGKLIGKTNTPHGTAQRTFALGAARDFALILVEDYRGKSQRIDGVDVSVRLSEAHAQRADSILKTVSKSLPLLKSKLVPFPFKQLTLAECTQLGARPSMEFSGFICLSPMSLEANPLQPDTGLAYIVNFQLAHQYFGLLVENDAVAQPAIDEALAVHWALLLTEWTAGTKASERLRETRVRQNYRLFRMLGGRDGPVTTAAHEFASATAYDGLLFGKAPLLFDAQREATKTESWEAAFKAYVQRHAFRWVDLNSFEDLFNRPAPLLSQNLKALEKHWWFEAHGDEDIGTITDADLLLNSLGMKGRQGPGLDAKTLRAFEDAVRQLGGFTP